MTTTQSNLHRLLSVHKLILWGDTMQFYIGKNTDIYTPLINPICTVPYYLWQVHGDVTKSDVPPHG